jgi:hypothetical protein
VYFGITCSDSNPKGIVATELRRDANQELDDYFEIVIDPDNDHRNGHVFQINPLGTQRDGLITEEYHGEEGTGDGDSGWDGIWQSEARVQERGWTATVQIPFATLNLRRSENIVWGLNFKRFIRRKNEEMLWAAWRRVEGATRISREGELHGIADIGNTHLLVVKPYVLAGYNNLSSGAVAAGLVPGGSAVHTAGVDVKAGLGPTLVGNLTVNTDFADTEVDLEQFNLTPYKLFYPEKREFFLENTGVFSFPLSAEETQDNLFFSRTIGIDPISGQEVPIIAGAKVTGPVGDYEVGALAIGSRAQGENPSADFEVARVKRALWAGSYVGAMAIDKQSGYPNDRFNQSAGVDTRLLFFNDLALSGYLAQTRTEGFDSGQSAWGAALKYQSNHADFVLDHRYLGANFNPEVGFLERQDCICDFVDLTTKFRPEVRTLREIQFEGFFSRALGTDNALQTEEFQATFRAQMENGAYTDDDIVDTTTQVLTTPFNVYRNVFIPVGEYRFPRHQIAFGTPRDRRWLVRVREQFGQYYNGTLDSTRIVIGYRPNERLSLNLIQEFDRFRLPIPDGRFSVKVGSLQTNYSLSRFLTASALLQVNTANDRPFGANIRLRWNYRPDSDLYIVYTSGTHVTNVTEQNSPQYYEQQFAVKWTYSWQL